MIFQRCLQSVTAGNGPQALRLTRTNVFPIFVLAVVVLVWCLVEFLGKIIPIFSIMGKGLSFVASAFTGKGRRKVVMAPGKRIRSK